MNFKFLFHAFDKHDEFCYILYLYWVMSNMPTFIKALNKRIKFLQGLIKPIYFGQTDSKVKTKKLQKLFSPFDFKQFNH